MATFAPLKHQKAPTVVLGQIRQAILSGALPAGSQLREAHIASEMGISRSPVREALSRLEEEGLVIGWVGANAVYWSVDVATAQLARAVAVKILRHQPNIVWQRLLDAKRPLSDVRHPPVRINLDETGGAG